MNLQDGALTAQQATVLAPLAGLLGLFFLGGLVADLWLLINLRRFRSKWREQTERLRARPWTWQDAAMLTLAALVLSQIAILLTGLQAQVLGQGTDPSGQGTDPSAMTLLLHTSWVPAGLLGLIFSLLRARGISWGQAFGMEGQSLRSSLRDALLPAALALFSLFPPLVACTLTAQFVLSKLGVAVESQEAVKFLTDSANPLGLRIYLGVAAVGIAPLIEEICFRGIILPAVSSHSRPWLAIMSVSIVFATIHFNAASFAPLLCLAASLSLSYIYSGTIITSVLIHATFNFMSILVLIATKLAGF